MIRCQLPLSVTNDTGCQIPLQPGRCKHFRVLRHPTHFGIWLSYMQKRFWSNYLDDGSYLYLVLNLRMTSIIYFVILPQMKHGNHKLVINFSKKYCQVIVILHDS